MNILPIQLLNMNQRHRRFYSEHCRVPRLITNSALYDLAEEKEALPIIHFLMMGFPVPFFVSKDLGACFPFPDIIALEPSDDSSILKDGEIRSLTGNGFHWAIMGASMMFSLATSTVQSGSMPDGA